MMPRIEWCTCLKNLFFILNAHSPAPTSAQEDWEKLCDASFSEQATLYKEERVVHVMKLADRIIAGKKRAQRDNDGIIDEKAALQKEIDKIPDMSTQCAQVFYRTSNTYLFFPNGLSEFFYPMDIYWIFHPGYNRCSVCGYSYTLKG